MRVCDFWVHDIFKLQFCIFFLIFAIFAIVQNLNTKPSGKKYKGGKNDKKNVCSTTVTTVE